MQPEYTTENLGGSVRIISAKKKVSSVSLPRTWGMLVFLEATSPTISRKESMFIPFVLLCLVRKEMEGFGEGALSIQHAQSG